MTFYDLKTDQRLIRLSIALVLLILILIAVFYNPDTYQITECGFKIFTGYSCPSCGLTRSFHAGANLDFAQSLSYHWIGPVLLLGVVFLFLKYSIESISGKTIQYKMKPVVIKLTLLVIAIVWLTFWISKLIAEISI